MGNGAREAGRAVGGDTGEKVGGGIYDVLDVVATVYSIGGGGATALSKTANALGQAGKVERVALPTVKSACFIEYSISTGSGALKGFVNLPKPWFRADNGVGAGVDATLKGYKIIGDK